MIFCTHSPRSRINSISLWMLILFLSLTSCSPFSTSTSITPISPTSIAAIATPDPTIAPIPTPTNPSLPPDLASLKIDGIKTNAEMDPRLNTWVWRDKKNVIRRLLDPLTNHLLARTSVAFDRLTFDIDYAFKWEVNIVNYANYGAHAPFGSAYIQILKLKYPLSFPQADENTGIIFRIIQSGFEEIPDPALVSYSAELGTEKEMAFLRPVYNPETNEYVFYLFLRTDYLTKKGAINTFTDWMLNYSLNLVYPQNPTGTWGIELYKHTIK
jgi:hypothetical protein